MEFLRKFWPLSFRDKPAVKDLVIMVIIYALAPTVTSFILGLLGNIPLVGIVFRVLGYIVGYIGGAYCTAGIVFTFLNYFKVGSFANEPKED